MVLHKIVLGGSVEIKDDLIAKMCEYLDRENAAKFKEYMAVNIDFVTQSDLDRLCFFFEKLQKQKGYDIYNAGKLIAFKKQAEDIGFSVFQYMNNQDISKFSHFCERYFFDLQKIKKQAFACQIASSKWVTDDVCRLLENEGKSMLLIDFEDRIFKGKINISPDREFNLYHRISAEGGEHLLMDTKAVLDFDDDRCLYYNDFLNYYPPKLSYIKKFGEQVKIAFQQEERLSEFGSKY